MGARRPARRLATSPVFAIVPDYMMSGYVNRVRRMGAVLSVMLGSALLDEPAVGDRLRGAVIASAGAVLLLLG